MEQPETSEFNLQSLFGIVKRQLRLILLTIFVVVSAAMIYAMTSTPLYRAEALVLVDPAEQNLLDPTETGSISSSALNARVESEVEILRSQAMALAVVDEANLISDPEFGPQLSLRAQLLQAIGLQRNEQIDGERLLKGVVNRFLNARSVRRSGLTYIIAVGVASEDAERAADLANTLARTYIDQQVRAKVQNALAARDVLNSQIANSQDRLARAEERLDNFIFDNLDRLEAESGAGEIASLRSELEDIERNRSAQVEVATRAEQALEAENWSALGDLLADQAIAELERQRRELVARLEGATEGSPLALDLRAELDTLSANLEDRATTNLSVLRDDLDEFDASADQFRDEIRTTLLRSDLSSDTLAQVFTLRQEAVFARQQAQALLSRLSQLETEALVQVADSRVVSEALPPNRAFFPDIGLILALALVGSTGLGLGLAFANEFYVGGVTSDSQLANVIRAPVGTTVPKMTISKELRSVADVVALKPLSGYAEALRHLRASLDQTFRTSAHLSESTSKDRRGKVILVCSSVPAEGKSTTALALARTYAMSGKNTVLIDADLRKPSLARQLGVTPEGSMLDYLTGKLPNEEELSFYRVDTYSNLLVFPGHGRSDVPTDQLLSSNRFNELVDAARESAEIVLIDSPPILPVVDTRYIVHHADAVVMVVRFASTNQTDVRRAVGQISEEMDPQTALIGVLSHREGAGTSYRYQGDYGYYTE